MKTRIKVVQYGNNTIKYIPQKFTLRENFGNFILLLCTVMFWVALFTEEFYWDDLGKFDTIYFAKLRIDEEILKYEKANEDKLAKKIKSKKYIKYP